MKRFKVQGGWVVLLLFTVATAAFVYVELRDFLGRSAGAQMANRRWFICTETKQAYQVDLADVHQIPAYSPFSHKNTGVPGELCYWTKDGKPKKEPTVVLLNKYLGLPSPTFCPDCGRLVVERNPSPDVTQTPPPTREEYEARQRKRGGE